MDWIIKFAKLFGFVGKLQTALQGKKTYLVNSIQVIGSLGGLLVALSVGLKAVSDLLHAILMFTDGTISAEQAQQSIALIIQQHGVILGGIVAAWYVLLDAFQNMTKYAADRRAEKKREEMMNELKAKGLLPELPIEPNINKDTNDGK